ncbi:hypothetical protein C8N42_12233 [Celeribacter persicus]|uniref:Uncharacterized protein n=1 Tax=Celeribacter persicus TaxID=1651082 RepID=A0A2T5H5I7_9RHOB|nr:hypothetical protein C8N42_12233 [Celeribacter persicus]
MLANLLHFYDLYPNILLHLKSIDRASLAPDLLESLEFHGHIYTP